MEKSDSVGRDSNLKTTHEEYPSVTTAYLSTSHFGKGKNIHC